MDWAFFFESRERGARALEERLGTNAMAEGLPAEGLESKGSQAIVWTRAFASLLSFSFFMFFFVHDQNNQSLIDDRLLFPYLAALSLHGGNFSLVERLDPLLEWKCCSIMQGNLEQLWDAL